jgi:hypothetical protein
VIEDGQWDGMAFEYHLPVGSLPSKFRNTRIDFPNEGKYLVPDPDLTAHWAARLDQLGSGFKVGIAWRSGIRPDRRSSIDSSLEDWGSVFRIPGVRWINLQLDDCAAELDQAKALFGVTVHRWSKERLDRDLESLVALIATLDAVIIPSTAISALTGAVGTRSWEIDAGNVWWSHGEERCPWFPTIRFARKRSGQQDWSATLDAVAEELAAHALEGARA